MLDWPFQSASTLAVQGLGFWLAIFGLLISVVGFWVTLAQLARTRRATTAVSAEVARIQFAVSRYDATIEASRAEALLLSVRKAIKAADWDQVSDAVEAFARSLHTLHALKVAQISIHQTDLEGAMAHANRLCERLDKAGRSGLPETETIKTLTSMRENGLLLTSIRIALGRSTISD